MSFICLICVFFYSLYLQPKILSLFSSTINLQLFFFSFLSFFFFLLFPVQKVFFFFRLVVIWKICQKMSQSLVDFANRFGSNTFNRSWVWRRLEKIVPLISWIWCDWEIFGVFITGICSSLTLSLNSICWLSTRITLYGAKEHVWRSGST